MPPLVDLALGLRSPLGEFESFWGCQTRPRPRMARVSPKDSVIGSNPIEGAKHAQKNML